MPLAKACMNERPVAVRTRMVRVEREGLLTFFEGCIEPIQIVQARRSLDMNCGVLRPLRFTDRELFGCRGIITHPEGHRRQAVMPPEGARILGDDLLVMRAGVG